MLINFFPGTGFGQTSLYGAPAGLFPAAEYVASLYDVIFTNPITLDITLNWGPQAPGVLASNGNSTNGFTVYSYSALTSALIAHEQSPTQIAAYATLLDDNPPSSANSYYLPPGQAEILGFIPPVNGQVPVISGGLTVTSQWLASSPTGPLTTLNWSFTPGFVPANLFGTTVPFDAIAAIEHETTETMMGRFSDNGTGNPATYTVMDLFRYSAPGQRDLSVAPTAFGSLGTIYLGNTTAYFSFDDGNTNLGAWNNETNGGDLGDWAQSPIPNDAFGGQGGGISPISEADFELMNILGWDLSPNVVYPTQTVYVSAGQTSHELMVIAGGTLVVEAGGTAAYLNYNGGDADIIGLDSGGLVWAGGAESIYSGGTAINTLVESVGLQIVGGVASNVMVDSGGTQIVEAGGGYESLSPPTGLGQTYGTTLSGGEQIVSSGGFTFDTMVGSASFEQVDAGGTALGTVVSSAGTENVHGADVSAVIDGGGYQEVFAGGNASGTTVSSGGTQQIDYGGTAIGATVFGAGAEQDNDGTASRTTLGGGGFEEVYGADYSATVSSGGLQIVLGGQTFGTLVLKGGTETVTLGTASGTILSGGTEQVQAAGIGSGTVISSGGIESVSGKDIDGRVLSGGTQNVSGGAVSGTFVANGGEQQIYFGGVATGATVSGTSGGTSISANIAEQVIYAGGRAVSTTLDSRAIEFVLSSGAAVHTTVNSGGTEWIGFIFNASGGIGISGVVSRDGVENVLNGGTASATVVSGLGAVENVLAGGFASDTKVYSGGTQNVSGGSAVDVMVDAGGSQSVVSDTSHNSGRVVSTTVSGFGGITGAAEQDISAGGIAFDTNVLSDGFQYVSSGGQVQGTLVSGAGQQRVYAGALAVGTTVARGGSDLVYGSAAFVTIGSGGTETVETGGRANFEEVDSAGTEYVYGTAISTFIKTSGTEIVESGGTVSGLISIEDGTLVLSAGAHVPGTITFADGGTLKIYGSSMPTTAISGVSLGAVIDLASIPFQNSGSATISGANVLQVSENGKTYNIELNPSQNFSAGRFALATDGASGTLVTFTPSSAYTVGQAQVRQVSASQTSTGLVVSAASYVSGAAYVEVLSGGTADGTRVVGNAYQWVFSGGFASGTIVSSGGQEDVWSGGSASGASIDSGAFQNVSSGGTTYGTMVNGGGEQNTYGTTYNTSVGLAGFQYVYGGTASNTMLDGGIQDVANSGTAVSTTVAGYFGTLFVSGIAVSASVGSGSYLYVENGGFLSGVSMIGSGALELISAGGSDIYTVVSGGMQQVAGIASQTLVADGVQTIYSGGTAQDADIVSGSVQQVLSGGSAYFSEIAASGAIATGGLQEVFAGGVAGPTVVAEGGEQLVLSGGTAFTTYDNIGGEMVVAGGGLASGVSAFNSGEVIINSGGELEGTAAISGGTLVLNAGAEITGPVVFGSGGLLEVDGPTMPTVTLSGFAAGDTIDLTGIPFDASGIANLEAGNLLQIVENGAAYDLQFDASQNFAGDQFMLAVDNAGGTEVTLGAQSSRRDRQRPSGIHLCRANERRSHRPQWRHAGRVVWRQCERHHARFRRRAKRLRIGERHEGRERRRR